MKRVKKSFMYQVLAITMIAVMCAGVVCAKESGMEQFTAGGHVLGFEKTGIYIATGSHALRIGFEGTTGVMPETNGAVSSDTGKAMPLHEVRYPDLWKGITLVCTCTDQGIFESTYYVESHADVKDIRLIYNVPVGMAENGGLELEFGTGYMTESAPVAWQEINGEKMPVLVSFRKIAEYEAGFVTGAYDPAFPLIIDPLLEWNTFMGSSVNDYGIAIAVDSSGNVYVAGRSGANWGLPKNPYTTGDDDAFVAKLDSSGALQWNTFMGSSAEDAGYDIAVDASGNVYVAGISSAEWGSPENIYTGAYDAFAAKLNSSGILQWNTFMGSSANDSGNGIAVDASGNVYVTGMSYAEWGSPEVPYTGDCDVFVAKLGSNGARLWNTFMGSSSGDSGNGIVVDSFGDPYVGGISRGSWGSPKNAYTGDADVFAAKLNSNSGVLQWNTFMGSSSIDYGYGIAVDGSRNVYLVGESYATWGLPENPHAGSINVFAVKLDSDGVRLWNTFMGSSSGDSGSGIAVDASGNIYVTGTSYATWGSPENPHAGGRDAFAAKLDSSGILQWNTFMGSSDVDSGNAIAVDGSGNLFVAGYSYATWGSPENPYSGGRDAFAAKLSEGGTPLLVQLASFTAAPFPDRVLLQWKTDSEIDNAGFHILRSNTANGIYDLITDYLIFSKSDFSLSGASYDYTDTDVAAGNTYFYKLEDTDYAGVSTLHGPVFATVPLRGDINEDGSVDTNDIRALSLLVRKGTASPEELAIGDMNEDGKLDRGDILALKRLVR